MFLEATISKLAAYCQISDLVLDPDIRTPLRFIFERNALLRFFAPVVLVQSHLVNSRGAARTATSHLTWV